MVEHVASLPMYDMPALRQATEAWWAGLSAQFSRFGLVDVPARLTWPGEGPEVWMSPALVFSQSCGYPLITELAGRVILLGTPCYDVDGCEEHDYCSYVIVHTDQPADSIAELRGLRCAVNKPGSWSGHHALRLIVEPLIEAGRPLFETVISGSHLASIDAVRNGAADFASVDCVSFGLLSRCQPDRTEGLKVLACTPAMPGLPLITGRSRGAADIEAMKAGLAAAFADPALREARKRLGLKAIHFTSIEDYAAVSDALAQLERQGIPPLV